MDRGEDEREIRGNQRKPQKVAITVHHMEGESDFALCSPPCGSLQDYRAGTSQPNATSANREKIKTITVSEGVCGEREGILVSTD